MSIEREGMMEVDIMDTPDITTKSVEEFAKENRVDADNSRRSCGDDRFEASQSKGAVRIFGGDEGILTAIKAAAKKAEVDVEAKDLVSKYSQILKKLYGDESKIEVHTATHALETGAIGCGFMDKAINVSGLHQDLSNQDAKEIHEAILSVPHEEVVLGGEHAAKSVLLVHGNQWSVNSKDQKEQNFVVDVDRATDFLRTITPMFEVYGLKAEDTISEFESQMNKTAEQLASGLNIYDINFDVQGHPTATFNGTVPSPELQN